MSRFLSFAKFVLITATLALSMTLWIPIASAEDGGAPPPPAAAPAVEPANASQKDVKAALEAAAKAGALADANKKLAEAHEALDKANKDLDAAKKGAAAPEDIAAKEKTVAEKSAAVDVAQKTVDALKSLVEGAKAPVFPSDEDRFSGDHIQLRTQVDSFEVIPETSPDNDGMKCAPKNARLSVTTEDDQWLLVRFLELPKNGWDCYLHQHICVRSKETITDCDSKSLVNTYTQYKIKKSVLKQVGYTRTGVTFGGLVVPFKFRFGTNKTLSASPAVAPYVGFRTGWFQSYGVTFTPVVAAGLSLVPVTNADTSATSTKTALTVAGGLRFTSSKSDAFSAGLLIGYDFINKSDREGDKSLTKPWLSFYVGASL